MEYDSKKKKKGTFGATLCTYLRVAGIEYWHANTLSVNQNIPLSKPFNMGVRMDSPGISAFYHD